MVEACGDCGSSMSCRSCCAKKARRSQSNFVTAGTGHGSGGPGLRKKKRRFGQPSYHITARLHQEERDALRALCEAGGCTASVVLGELLVAAAAEAERRKRPERVEPDAEYLARRARFSTPGNAPQRPPDRLKPVIPGVGTFER